MKHVTSRFLFSYWEALRGERAAPERRDIEPGRIRQVLADTFILAMATDGSTEFRLVGTRVAALFGRSLKGESFDGLWPRERQSEPASLVEIVSSDMTGLVAGLMGSTELGATVGLELLLLPLRHQGATHSRLLGTLSPVVTPSWAGLMPITDLELRSVRVIRTAPKRVADIRGAGADGTTPRPRLVVLQGGLQS